MGYENTSYRVPWRGNHGSGQNTILLDIFRNRRLCVSLNCWNDVNGFTHVFFGLRKGSLAHDRVAKLVSVSICTSFLNVYLFIDCTKISEDNPVTTPLIVGSLFI